MLSGERCSHSAILHSDFDAHGSRDGFGIAKQFRNDVAQRKTGNVQYHRCDG